MRRRGASACSPGTSLRRRCGAARGPDFAEEYLVYQTLVGVWPIEPERLRAYLVKALREAKRHTSWAAPDELREEQVTAFALALLEHVPFREDFAAFLGPVVEQGRRSALGQLLLKLTCPGVPDVFQGDELWRLSLVDPDNRRPVDWQERRAALDRVRGAARPGEGDEKIFLIHRALALRARREETFSGAYIPVAAGPDVCAYLRGDAEVLVVATVRAAAGADPVLGGGVAGRWREVLGGREVDLEGPSPLSALGEDFHGLWLLERR